jgi:hypothetical protein
MFIRMVKTKSGNKTHCYLRVVESFRSNGRVRQRVLWNMGKWERVRRGLPGLVKSMSRFSGQQFLTVKEIKHKQVREYGNILLLKSLWESSGFKEILEANLGAKANCIMALVFHRLCQPATSLPGWLKRVYLPEAERLVRLGQQRLKKRLLNSMASLSRLEWTKGQRGPSPAKTCVIEVSPVSPSRGRFQTCPYLATVPLKGNDLTRCNVYARKEFKTLLQAVGAGLKPAPTKKILIARYSALGRDGVAFLDKKAIPYMVFMKRGRLTRKRSRRKGRVTLPLWYGNQRVYLRTNVRTTTPNKARRAFKGLLETETALSQPPLPHLVPPGKAYLKGCLLVSLLAYLLGRTLREGLSRHGLPLSPAEALDTLKEIRLVNNLLAGKRWDYLTGVTRERRTLLKAFRIKMSRLKRQSSNR